MDKSVVLKEVINGNYKREFLDSLLTAENKDQEILFSKANEKKA